MFPASFACRGPAEELRSARTFSGGQVHRWSRPAVLNTTAKCSDHYKYLTAWCCDWPIRIWVAKLMHRNLLLYINWCVLLTDGWSVWFQQRACKNWPVQMDAKQRHGLLAVSRWWNHPTGLNAHQSLHKCFCWVFVWYMRFLCLI